MRDRKSIDIFMLYPRGRVSEVQRRQMTTVLAPNVHNIAIQGTFDDCQDLAKACFNDLAFRDRHALTAVNSINFARVMAQIVYYFWAALKLGAPERPVAFTVPTGNFGNVYAGYAAKQMGLPIHHFVIGSNTNDILPRFFETGAMTMSGVVPTYSPSMDIQISSNFERLLFDLYGRDGKALADAMATFRSTGTLEGRRQCAGRRARAVRCRPARRRRARWPPLPIAASASARRSIRTARSATRWRSSTGAIRRCRWSCWRRRIPPSFPTRCRRRRASGRACRRGWPTCSTAPSGSTGCRTISTR